jgi:hypothetical protein
MSHTCSCFADDPLAGFVYSHKVHLSKSERYELSAKANLPLLVVGLPW